MAPKIRASPLSSSLTLPSSSSSRTRPSRIRCLREFSQTPSHQAVTRQRRMMWGWMNSIGANFKDPLPGSTNYLSAYDRSGNLIRERKTDEEIQAEKDEEENGKAKKDKRKENEDPDAEELEDDPSRRDKKSAKKREESKRPAERPQDLQPFPLNQHFRSEPVLSEDLREDIWNQVINGVRDGQTGELVKQSVRVVSATMGISMERVAAVVRLKEVEKQWERENKPLTRFYSRAVLSMLPTTPLARRTNSNASSSRSDTRQKPHESVNDLPVHAATRQQIFHPVSESRTFTREDAGKVFDPRLPLLPADERIPHPELVILQKEANSGMTRSEREDAQRKRNAVEAARKEAQKRREEAKEKAKTVVAGRRWDFKFEEVSVDAVGRTGRAAGGVGWRYGVPLDDRKRGKVKIPTKVEA